VHCHQHRIIFLVICVATMYAISAYHHTRSNPLMARCTRFNIVIKFVNDLRQVGGFLRVLHCLKQELYMRAINLNIALLRLYFCADLCIAINIESSFILQFIGLGL
jgi:hypothetical protein